MRDKNVRQLWGKDFEIVKDGLAESQVIGFATDIINERNNLLQSQEHLESLTRLAERTVIEADKMAKEIKLEAEEKANIQVSHILAEAEKQAEALMKQRQSEILAMANEEAANIKTSAEQEANHMLVKYKQQLQTETKEITQKLHGHLVSDLEGLMQQAVTLQTEWESKLSEIVISNTSLTSNREVLSDTPQKAQVEFSSLPEIIPENSNDTIETAQKAHVYNTTIAQSRGEFENYLELDTLPTTEQDDTNIIDASIMLVSSCSVVGRVSSSR
ncbi:hypothetical protein ACFLTP_01955 [Chloroflexota bacterium]